MAAVTAEIASFQNDTAWIKVTFDDATRVIAGVSWSNQSAGTMSVLVTQPGKQDITRSITPGDSGSVPVSPAAGYTLPSKAQPSPISFSVDWVTS